MNRRLLFLYGWSHPCFGSWRNGSLCGRYAVGGCCRTQVVGGFVVGCLDCRFLTVASSVLSASSPVFIVPQQSMLVLALCPSRRKRAAVERSRSEYRCCFLFSPLSERAIGDGILRLGISLRSVCRLCLAVYGIVVVEETSFLSTDRLPRYFGCTDFGSWLPLCSDLRIRSSRWRYSNSRFFILSNVVRNSITI